MNRILTFLTTLLLLTSAKAQTPAATPAPATDCQFHVLADDSFELFINGKLTWKSDDYQNIVQKTIPLRRGDVVVFSVTDKQGGPGGCFAALIVRANAILASSKDFRYSVKPTSDFTTSTSIQNLRMPDLEPLKRSFGLGPDKQPKRAWTQKSDRTFAVAHFKYVVLQ